MKKKSETTAVPVLALAELSGYTAAQTAKEFAVRVNIRSRAFVEQGKLVYHLRTLTLKKSKGQSVYSILQGQGVAEGSVAQAVMTADLIEALIISGLLSETRFDEVITFRIARFARKLITGKKSAIQLTAENVAAIMKDGQSAAIGAELECLCEHGMTIADREADIVKKAEERARLEAAAAEANRLRAAEEARKAAEAAEAARKAAETPAPMPPPAPPTGTQDAGTPNANGNPVSEISHSEPEKTPAAPDTPETPAVELPEETESESPESEEAETPDPEEEPEPLVVDGIGGNKGGNTPPPPPSGPTLVTVTSQINDILTTALDLPAADLEKLVGFLRNATNDIAATLKTLEVHAA